MVFVSWLTGSRLGRFRCSSPRLLLQPEVVTDDVSDFEPFI